MSKYLISTTEVYRTDSEAEAQNLIAEAKADKNYTLTKYSTEHKDIKMKGEIVDSYCKVSLVKTFTDIKEPDVMTTVTYDSDMVGGFPHV